jgi:cation diffusion facilitator CzcD-associated flavoprotein CzcO
MRLGLGSAIEMTHAFPIAIVGAGPSGLSLVRAMRKHGIPCVAYERHSDVGGIWDTTNTGSPIYKSAHFISSKTQSHYIDYDMPADYPDYPSNRQILSYMRGFADAYDLRRDVRFDTSVVSTQKIGNAWDVRLSTGEVVRHSALICANGTNWHGVMPDYPGTFTGEMRHSSTFKSADEFAGKRVLIIGAGNSGCDIACDAARAADKAFISLRRGYHFIPKHLFGIPSDKFAAEGPKMPMWLEQSVFGFLLNILNGDLTRLGLQKPDHKIFETHPILNTQLLHHLAHGDIAARQDITRFEGQTVHFKDGKSEEVDLIIAATGYRWDIPYLARGAISWRENRPDMFLNLFSRTDPTLYTFGFMETNGGAYKMFDEMADFVANAIATRGAGGTWAQTLNTLIATEQLDLTGGIKFAASARHATYVDSTTYRAQLRKLRTRMGWPQIETGAFERLRAA